MSRAGSTDRSRVRRLDEAHALGILGERLAADHQVVGVEHVAQQRDGLARAPWPARPAARGPAGCPAVPHRSTAVHRRRGSVGRDDARLAGGDQHRLVAYRGLQLAGAAEQFRVRRAARRWCRGRWRVNAPARRSTARSRRFRGRRRTGWSSIVSAGGAPRAAVRRPPSRRRGRRPTPAGRASRRARARPARPTSPAAGGRGSRWCCRRRRPRRRRPTAGGGGASGSGSGGRCLPATPARRPARRAGSASRRRRACGRTGRWPRCWWCGRRCGCRASGTARG